MTSTCLTCRFEPVIWTTSLRLRFRTMQILVSEPLVVVPQTLQHSLVVEALRPRLARHLLSALQALRLLAGALRLVAAKQQTSHQRQLWPTAKRGVDNHARQPLLQLTSAQFSPLAFVRTDAVTTHNHSGASGG